MPWVIGWVADDPSSISAKGRGLDPRRSTCFRELSSELGGIRHALSRSTCFRGVTSVADFRRGYGNNSAISACTRSLMLSRMTRTASIP